MPGRSDPEDKEDVRRRLIGLGERSIRKTYYPELQERMAELERFRALVEQANDAILLVREHDLALVDANRAACAATGYSCGDLRGRSLDDLVPAQAAGLFRDLFSGRVGEDRTALTTTLRSKSGRVTPVEMTVSLHAFGEERYIVAVSRDISRRIEAERRLRLARLRLEDVIDSMPSVLAEVDEDCRITLWNARAAQETGLTLEQAQGRPLAEVLPLLAGHEEEVRQAMRLREPRPVGVVRRKVGDQTSFAEIMVYPLSGEEPGAVVRVDDITARVRMEEVMVRTEKMTTVGGLAAGMAHEINNPLGSIIQSAQNLRRRLSPDLPANRAAAERCGLEMESLSAYLEQRGILRMLEAIRESGERAGRMVRNMLRFSRSGESSLLPTDLVVLLDAVLDLAANDYDLKKKHRFREIELVRDYEPGLPPVPCSSSEIEQVLLNLVKNAAQAMSGREGRPRLTLRLRREGESIRVEVEDNGPGMDEATRKRVFEPFFTTKPVGEGTGLGLFVSWFIVVQNHGGALRIESEPGRGARVILALPLRGRRPSDASPLSR